MKRRKPPRDPRGLNFSRRRFLAGMTAAAGAVVVPGCGDPAPTGTGGGSGSPDVGPSALPANPEDSGIDFIVHVQMENRSFDHMLGWVPGADGVQSRTLKNVNGEDVQTFHLASDGDYGYQGCGWADPNHGYDGGRVHLAGGRMDGFLLTGGTADNPADRFPAGYYLADDVPFYKGVAQHFTVCDRYFHGILNSTFPNRIYMHAGQTDRPDNAFYPPGTSAPGPASIETIWDRLAAKGVSGTNYFSDLPLTALWGAKYAGITATFEQFLADAAAGTLSSVSYFDPNFGYSVGEDPGLSRDDHPHADIRDGQAYLDQIYRALSSGPLWDRTLMIVTYDEWGGFFDHVVPPFKPISDAEREATKTVTNPGGNDGRLGFRTPCVLIGPRARRGHVSKIQFDPQSLIDLITWRFGLDPLGARAGTAITNNFAVALDFTSPPNTDAPDFGVPSGPGGAPFGVPFANLCDSPLPGPGDLLAGKSLSPAERSRLEHQQEFAPLAAMARDAGMI
ncbi:MAG TPA: alkaline phosphatase family protein [Candidatus Binatia bacterium]|nr:alkaline phosphatase family protein [Candidatus Binatia bacterium]